MNQGKEGTHMMLDKNIVADKVRDKVLDMTFAAIVESCFIEALPFEKENMKPHVHDLMVYTDTVLESLVIGDHKVNNKFEILLHALESETDTQKRHFLNKIASTCISTAMEVSNRITSDDDLLKNSSIDDILESVGLDENEREEFNNNVTELNTDKIAEVIQDKVIKAIKTEKEDEEKAIALEDKLKDALTLDDDKKDDEDLDDDYSDIKDEDDGDDLNDNPDDEEDENKDDTDDELGVDDELDDKGMPIDDTSDDDASSEPEGNEVNVDDKNKEKDKKNGNGDDINININIEQDKSKKNKANESMSMSDKAYNVFCNLRISPFHAKAPISFLSRITDYAIEAVMRTDDLNSEIPMNAVYKVTFSPMMEFFNREIDYNDIIQEAMIDRDVALEASSLEDKPMIVSIIVYTVMETLKTLNLFSPSVSQIKKIVDTSNIGDGNSNDKMTVAREEINKRIEKLTGEIESAVNYTQLSDAEMDIDSIKNDYEIMNSKGVVLESFSASMNRLQLMINQKKNEVLKDDGPIISNETRRIATESEFGIEKINRLYANHPRVSFITMDIDTSKESCNPKISMRDSNGNIVCETYMYLTNHNLKNDALIKAIGMGIESQTHMSGKPLTITDSAQNGKVTKFTI